MEFVKTEKVHYGPLAKGCEQCIEGRKSVLFITGICHYKCFYCPISDEKRYKDVVKINERVVARPDAPEGINEAIEEIRLCQSKGVGITGGDPLMRLERTCRYIEAFKEEFGYDFHIHLYTTLDHVTQEALFQLEEAGLDELRLHFNVADILLWEKAHFAEGMNFTVGAEVPAIPGFGEKTKELINYCKQLGFIEFVNLNELEYSDASQARFEELKLAVKDDLSYGINGSEELAKELVDFGKNRTMPVHYCSAEFKDKVQLGNRLRLRAESVARAFDSVDEQGMLYRAELKPVNQERESRPDRETTEKDERDEHEKEVDHVVEKMGLLDLPDEEEPEEESSGFDTLYEGFTLEGIRQQLIRNYDIPEELIEVQDGRILTAPHILKEIWPQIKRKRKFFGWKNQFEAALVTEYPTSDHFPIDREVL
ncbi:MAG: radical SAM protein [Candidatus Woesearchaeota archaeon]